ncbi:hypothetical protein I545_4463 [Mycobacterium kansasii 662]|uniref:Uncharacterized protein n=2 Tax=Mycobacterium kansasii TaxID=1768 RepID=A0A1V3WPS4_MYCKA|nr:hypothetical protein I547_1952 [Mycobacterium kansasii 824]EUA15927.1 hypothetical protein I545_4463 [Mycobacterium kansasii 662]OOK68967.1 hypothetical protein BZL30_7189 [Mycobacterium kansasii]OOK69872.1 hypothetical protein BZL29_6308 [Mycobacterium kansasii]
MYYGAFLDFKFDRPQFRSHPVGQRGDTGPRGRDVEGGGSSGSRGMHSTPASSHPVPDRSSVL